MTLVFLGCSAHYRAARLETFAGPDTEKDPVILTYAVTKNNYIIPEYVIDRKGDFPTSEEEAWYRFENRREELEPTISQKYVTGNNFWYQSKRIFLGIAFTLVAPVALPITYLGEKFSSDESRRLRPEDAHVVRAYFRNAFHGKNPKKPVLNENWEGPSEP